MFLYIADVSAKRLSLFSFSAPVIPICIYMREVNATLDHNIRHILQEEKRKIKQIKQEEAHFSARVFSVLAIIFAAVAGWSFSQQHIMLAVVLLAGALLAFVILGVVLSW